MIKDFEESICQEWDDGKLSEHAMINIMIAKIRELSDEVNSLRKRFDEVKEAYHLE